MLQRLASVSIAALLFCGCEEPVVPNDPANANLYQSCEEGKLQSCVELGENYANGNRVGWRPERAIALYEKACKGGYADGCQHAGLFLEEGHALLQPDFKRASKYLAQACDAGLLQSCTALAYLYHSGPIRHNHKRAAQLYEYACDNGDASACVRGGSMFRSGEGVPTNTKRASLLFRRGCDSGNAQSCTFLGENYFMAWGVPRDNEAGWSFVQKGCAMKDQMACGVVQSSAPAAEGSPKASKRVWQHLISAPSPASIFTNARSYDEVIARLVRLRDAYGKIDLEGAHTELAVYAKAWQSWASDMIGLCERDRQQQATSSNIETFSGLMGAWLEKNESGERDDASLERGMSKGKEVGRGVASVIASATNGQLAADGKALGIRATQLATYQDSLAIRMEMVYHIGFPPPKEHN